MKGEELLEVIKSSLYNEYLIIINFRTLKFKKDNYLSGITFLAQQIHEVNYISDNQRMINELERFQLNNIKKSAKIIEQLQPLAN